MTINLKDPAYDDHPTFTFIKPTNERINRSVAWVAKCKHCGAAQLVGATQIKLNQHTRCLECQIKPPQTKRSIA